MRSRVISGASSVCLALGAAIALTACNALSGVGDLRFDGAGGAGGEGTTVSVGTQGGGGEGGSTTPECGEGFECVPAASEDLYLVLPEGESSCPPGWGSPQMLANAADPGCAPCTCSTLGVGACGPSTVTAFSDGACASSLSSVMLSFPMCHDTTSTGLDGRSASVPVASPLPCAPSAGLPAPVPISTLCALAESPSACGAGSVCVPASAGAAGGFCRPARGMSCPAGLKPTVLALVEEDTRACSCSCGMMQGQACNQGGGISLFNSDNCSGGAVSTFPIDGLCHDLSAFPSYSSIQYEPPGWSPGACPPESSQTGTVTFGPGETLCCDL